MDWKLLLSNARCSREELKRVPLDDHISFLTSFVEYWDSDLYQLLPVLRWEINRLRTLEARRQAKRLMRDTQAAASSTAARRL